MRSDRPAITFIYALVHRDRAMMYVRERLVQADVNIDVNVSEGGRLGGGLR